MNLIPPHFSKPVTAAAPLGVVPVAFTKAEDDDDDDDYYDGPDKMQQIGIAALIVAGVLVSRGKLKPSTAWKVIKFGAGATMKAGIPGTLLLGGHKYDENAKLPLPSSQHPLPPSPLPPPPLSTEPVIRRAAVAVGTRVYGVAIGSAIRAHPADGNALDLIALFRRLIYPRGFYDAGAARDLLGVIGGELPAGGIIRELEIAFDILRRMKLISGGSNVVDPLNYPETGKGALFGGMGDVMQANPKGIVNNLTRQAKGGEKGPGRDLVAQTGDP